MEKIKITVLGEPKGKGRPVFCRKGKYVSVKTPEDTVSYENLVKIEYRNQTNDFRFSDDSYLKMEIVAYYSIPKSASKKKTAKMLSGEIRPIKKPDLDNIAKVIADALNKIAYRDDSQIVEMTIKKMYSERPRVEVKIIDITEE